MTTRESFDSIIIHCPIGEETVDCPVLARDLEIARESSGEVFVGNEIRDRDSSNQRVIMLMRGAINKVINNPCEYCPYQISKEV